MAGLDCSKKTTRKTALDHSLSWVMKCCQFRQRRPPAYVRRTYKNRRETTLLLLCLLLLLCTYDTSSPPLASTRSSLYLLLLCTRGALGKRDCPLSAPSLLYVRISTPPVVCVLTRRVNACGTSTAKSWSECCAKPAEPRADQTRTLPWSSSSPIATTF